MGTAWRRRLGWQMRRLHAGGFRLCLKGWRLGLSSCLREQKRSWMLLSRRSRRTRRGRGSWEAWRRRRKRQRRRKQIRWRRRASLPRPARSRLWHTPRIISIAIPICRPGMCDHSSHPSSRKFAEQQPHLRSGLRWLVNTQQAADKSYSAPGSRLPLGRAAAAADLRELSAVGRSRQQPPPGMAQLPARCQWPSSAASCIAFALAAPAPQTSAGLS